MTLIEQIKEDMEKGADGPWEHVDGQIWLTLGEPPIDAFYYHSVVADVRVNSGWPRYKKNPWELNASRIARVPDMEAALLAAEGCANWCDALIEMVEFTSCDPDDPEAFDEVLMGAKTFLKNYRAATEASQ